MTSCGPDGRIPKRPPKELKRLMMMMMIMVVYNSEMA